MRDNSESDESSDSNSSFVTDEKARVAETSEDDPRGEQGEDDSNE